ncbi:hypothetical protein BJX99DRAFT_228588 [Aspergillus californicus]
MLQLRRGWRSRRNTSVVSLFLSAIYRSRALNTLRYRQVMTGLETHPAAVPYQGTDLCSSTEEDSADLADTRYRPCAFNTT